MFKKIIILTAMLVAALTISASATEFTDVPETHWAHDSINFVSDRGIINGIGNNCFGPDAPVTVEQFATMLVRCFAPDASTADDAWHMSWDEFWAEVQNYGAYIPQRVEDICAEVDNELRTRAYYTDSYYSEELGEYVNDFYVNGEQVSFSEYSAYIDANLPNALDYLTDTEKEAMFNAYLEDVRNTLPALAGCFAGDAWYTSYMFAAYNEEYLTNVTTSTTEPLNRFNMAHMIYNVLPVLPYAAVNDDPTDTTWTEVTSKIGDWGTGIPYYEDAFGVAEYIATDLQRAIYACYKTGLLTGVNAAGEFKGEGTMTRSQAAVVMERIINYVDSFSPAAHPIPAGAQRVTKISSRGLQGSDTVGETFNIVGGSTASVSSMGIKNPNGCSKITFTVTPTSYDAGIYCSGTGVGLWEYVVRLDETATLTFDLEGTGSFSVSCGLAYSNYTISNMYLHN